MDTRLQENLRAFFNQRDESGMTNLQKVRERQHIIRRVATTDKSRSYEDSDQKTQAGEFPAGVVMQDDKLIGFGIHIFNEDIYPLQSFEIYLRNCDLTGKLDLSDAGDLLFIDLYHNRISEICTAGLDSLRILGLQDNLLESLEPSTAPHCLGIDAGMNRLKTLDVSRNPELVELYVNDNQITEIDLSHNPALKYFYCHNNGIMELDTRNNPLLRHLNASGNPMKRILSLAPQREERLPLELYSEEGGTVGLKFYPVYNAQWKETGEWRQSYHAYPDEGWSFAGWFNLDGEKVGDQAEWLDEYGSSRILTAKFRKAERTDI